MKEGLKFTKIFEDVTYATVNNTVGMGDVAAPIPPGMDAAKPGDFGSGDKFDSITPSIFKMPMGKAKRSNRSMTFDDFLKRIDYKTHESHLNVTNQRK